MYAGGSGFPVDVICSFFFSCRGFRLSGGRYLLVFSQAVFGGLQLH
jgi:hypothetical protein